MSGKQIVGMESKKGTFKNDAGQDIAYDNVYLHLIGSNPKVEGSAVSVLKVKSELADGLQIGDCINLIYDMRNDGTPYLCDIEVLAGE